MNSRVFNHIIDMIKMSMTKTKSLCLVLVFGFSEMKQEHNVLDVASITCITSEAHDLQTCSTSIPCTLPSLAGIRTNADIWTRLL